MAKAPAAEAKDEAKPICGIIMPIAAMPPKYDASHWIDVRRVIDAAIIKADMTPQIVSDSFEGDVIQRRIISNLYDNPVVVCDVSGLNPNVMFELGMRVTFKQPVVIITDNYDDLPFDTKIIEHLGYPRDLHIHQTNEFIEKLAERISRLHEKKKENKFKSFIEEFGTFEVLEPTTNFVGPEQIILDRLDGIERRLARMPAQSRSRGAENLLLGSFISSSVDNSPVCIVRLKPDASKEVLKEIEFHIERRYRTKNHQIHFSQDGSMELKFALIGDNPDYSVIVDTMWKMMPAHLREYVVAIGFGSD